MASVGENRGDGLARIADYINQLQFKKAVVGGIAQESAYQAMRDLVSIFTEVYTQETERSAELEAQVLSLRSDLTRANQESENWKTQAQRLESGEGGPISADPALKSRISELERELEAVRARESETKRASEKSEARVAKLETENAVLRQQLVQPETGLTEMMGEVKLQLEERDGKIRSLTQEKSDLESRMQRAQGAREQAEQQLATLRSENADLRDRLSRAGSDQSMLRQAEQARAQAEQALSTLRSENASLRDQLGRAGAASAGELDQLQNQMKTQLGELTERLSRAEDENRSLTEQLRRAKEQAEEADFQHETLEQIYIDANRRRKETVDAANAQAESILRASEAEARKRRQQIENEIAETRAQMDREMEIFNQKRQEDVEQYEEERRQARERFEAEMEENRAKRDGILTEAKAEQERILHQAQADAEKIVSEAQAQADQCRIQAENLVQSANSTYKKERARYEDLLHRLGELRASAMRDIQEDMNRFQAMAFELSNSSIGAETRALVGLDQMDDLQNDESAPNPLEGDV